MYPTIHRAKQRKSEATYPLYFKCHPLIRPHSKVLGFSISFQWQSHGLCEVQHTWAEGEVRGDALLSDKPPQWFDATKCISR